VRDPVSFEDLTPKSGWNSTALGATVISGKLAELAHDMRADRLAQHA
jgi:hypothetical protein